MKGLLKGILAAAFILSFGVSLAASPEKKAEKSSKKWLELVDGGNYAESYDETAAFFKNAVTKEEWVKSLNAFRRPLGEVISRKLISTQRKSSMPGAPDGEYVILQYKTSFDKKKSAIETVVPMLDKDGEWRVSGYYLR